jgi:Transglycosylase SLT domain
MKERSGTSRHAPGRWARVLGLAIVYWVLSGVILSPHNHGLGASDRGSRDAEGDRAVAVTGAMSMSGLLTDAEWRARAVELQARGVEAFYETEVDPLVRDLVWLGGDSAHAKRIAVALVREGFRADVDPRLLLAVMRVENPWLDLSAASPVGAVGLMQVMPFHAGGWGCGGDDLTDLDLNICHGTKILAGLIDRFDGDLERALLRYNGCVLGISRSKNCHLYPSWVLQHTGPSWASESPRTQLVASAAPKELVD